jgi:membrane protein
VLLAISVTSALIDQDATTNTVSDAIQRFLPKNTEATTAISTVVSEIDTVFNYSTRAGWIAGIALLWLASTLFGSMRSGLNAIFHIPTPRFFILYKLKDLVMTVIVAVLVMAATVATPLLSLLETSWQHLLPGDTWVWFHAMGSRFTSITFTTVVFLVLYRVVPNKNLPWPIILMSTVFAVVFWEGARVLFTWYMSSASNLSKFYGGYLALASLALWLYYSSVLFLLSAELAQFVYTRRVEQRSPTA